MLDKRTDKRILVSAKENELTIRIRNPKHWRVFQGIGFLSFIAFLIFYSSERIGVWLLFGAPLILYTLYYVYYAVRLVFGAEVVRIRDSVFTVKQDLFGRGREISVPLKMITGFEVTDMHVMERSPRFSWASKEGLVKLELTGERLAAETKKGKIRFGYQIKKDDAKHLKEVLEEYRVRMCSNSNSPTPAPLG